MIVVEPIVEMVCKSMKLRSTSHMSEGLWPCNGEGCWLSSKGHTMGVGIAILCSHGSSRIVWKWEWTMLRDHCIFYWWKRGTTLLVTYLHFFFTFWIWHWWRKKEKSMMDHLERRGRDFVVRPWIYNPFKIFFKGFRRLLSYLNFLLKVLLTYA